MDAEESRRRERPRRTSREASGPRVQGHQRATRDESHDDESKGKQESQSGFEPLLSFSPSCIEKGDTNVSRFCLREVALNGRNAWARNY